MIAASYWSLLAPAIEIAEESGVYGNWAFLPAAIGFGLGAAALFATESVLPALEKLFGKPENLHKKDDDLRTADVSASWSSGPDPMASYGVHISSKTNRCGAASLHGAVLNSSSLTLLAVAQLPPRAAARDRDHAAQPAGGYGGRRRLWEHRPQPQLDVLERCEPHDRHR